MVIFLKKTLIRFPNLCSKKQLKFVYTFVYTGWMTCSNLLVYWVFQTWCREFKSPFRYEWKSRESEKNPGIFFDHNNFSEIFCCTKTGKNIRNDLADIREALSVPGFSLKRFPVILLQDNIRPRMMLNSR